MSIVRQYSQEGRAPESLPKVLLRLLQPLPALFGLHPEFPPAAALVVPKLQALKIACS
jgi:hypothetical protein